MPRNASNSTQDAFFEEVRQIGAAWLQSCYWAPGLSPAIGNGIQKGKCEWCFAHVYGTAEPIGEEIRPADNFQQAFDFDIQTDV